MWEFFSRLIDTPAGQIAVFAVLAIAAAAVVQFVRGDWKLVKTKEGKVIFTTSQQRTGYDAAKSGAKIIRQYTADNEKRFDDFRKDKAETDAAILGRLDKLESELTGKNDMLEWRRDLLKLTFYSDEIRRIRPCEALRAGINYVKSGGSGEVKEDVLAYCKEHRELYRGLQAGSGACRLDELKIGEDV